MSCEKCGSTLHVRNVKGIGNRCYSCFDELIMKMLEYQETWLDEDIFPDIKLKIVDGIMKDGDNFDIKQFIKDSPHTSEIIDLAIDEMLSGNALPEVVRKFLNDYTGNIMDYVDTESGEEDD